MAAPAIQRIYVVELSCYCMKPLKSFAKYKPQRGDVMWCFNHKGDKVIQYVTEIERGSLDWDYYSTQIAAANATI